MLLDTSMKWLLSVLAVGWYHQYNHPCQILCQSVQQFWRSNTHNFPIFYMLSWYFMLHCEFYGSNFSRSVASCCELKLYRRDLSSHVSVRPWQNRVGGPIDPPPQRCDHIPLGILVEHIISVQPLRIKWNQWNS